MISTTKRLLINEWITQSEDALRELTFDDTVVETIFEFLENPDSDLVLLKAITKKLYELYQTGDVRLRLLTLCFLPPLVAIYIRVAHNYYHMPKSEFHSLAVLLLAVYNCEIMEPSPDAADSGRLKTIEVRVISLMKPSIYHEPNSHTQSNQNVSIPTEQVLARINNPNESKISIFGPYEEVEQLVAANYMSVCTVLLKVYNHHISEMGTFSHSSLSQLYLRLLKQGTNINIKEKICEYLQDTTDVHSQTQHNSQHHKHTKISHSHALVLPRNSVQIQFNSTFLVELTKSIYFCIYNEMTDVAFEVLDLIAKRATLKLYGDVLLMVNAIKNSISIKHDRDRFVEGTPEAMANPTKSYNGAAHATSMNSLNSFSGESKWTNVRRTAITTASFKTRKLPDDIPIVASNVPTTPGVATPGRELPTGVVPSVKGTLPTGQSTPPTPPTSNHHGHHHLIKNLDSIDEESTEKLLANGDSGKSGNLSAAKRTGKKNPVMNLLKELKDSKQKLPKMSSKENGKLQNNNNSTNSSYHNAIANLNHSKDRESDTSGLSDGCTKLSLGDSEEADIIPMRRLNKFIDDDTGDEDEDRDELDGADLEEYNGQADHRTGADEDEGSSDRSGASSKGLLASSKKSAADGKSAAAMKLSVP